MKKKLLVFLLSLCMAIAMVPTTASHAAVTGQYTNPLMNGADPTIVRGDDGYYYSGFGTDNNIYIKRSETLLGLSTAESHMVWENPNKGNEDNNKNYYVWGPYIYRINGAWYIYYSSSTENDFGYGHPSSYVLENTSVDPYEGEWVLKGKNTNVDDFEGNSSEKAGLINTESYGLVCGVITIGGEQYFTYTKYDYITSEAGNTKFNECPTIVKMENPWTLTGPECTVARPTYSWEKVGDNINEGCAVLEHDGKVYFAYSASSYTKDGYCVGLSVCDLNDDVMDEKNWKKSTEPLLKMSSEDSAFGPGSPLFVKSPDGTEDWLIYHAGPIDGQTSTDRRVRACLVNWTDEGEMNLGIPSNPDTVLDYPSGEDKSETYEAEYAASSNVTRKIFNNTAKASGSGYMMFDKEGQGYIEFTVDADKAANYTLGFRYNNIGDSAVTADVSVNGSVIATPSFAVNGNYAVDLNNLWLYNVALNEGSNTVRITVNGASALNLDTLIVKRASKYEATGASLENGAYIEGGNHVGGMYSDDATVNFNVTVPTEGYYSVKLEYANGFEDKKAGLYVNGTYYGEKTVAHVSDDWNATGTRIDNVYLNAGANTISYKNDVKKTGNKGDVNYYNIVVTEAATATYYVESVDKTAAVYETAGTESETETTETPAVTEPEEEKEPVYKTVYETVKLEAEDAELDLGASLAKDHTGYSGDCFVGGMWGGNASITFTVSTDVEDDYEITIGYGNGGTERHAGIKVNGVHAEEGGYAVLPHLDNWDTWSTAKYTVHLNKGENTITIYNNAEENGGTPGDANYDYIELNVAKLVEDTEAVTEEKETEEPVTPETTETPVDATYKSDAAKYTVTVESEALYDITMNYSLSETDDAEYIVTVNGEVKKTIAFSQNESKKTLCLKLNRGTNEIKISRLSKDGSESKLSAGSIHLVRRLPWIYQAENSTLSGVSTATDHIQYNGTAFVGGFESEGNSVTFNVNVATSGTHTETLRYSGAWDHDITMSLYVNGVKIKQVSLAPTASWDSWNEATEEIYLRAGKNTIEFKRDSEDSGCFNVDQLTIDKYSTGETTVKNQLTSGEVYVIKSKISNAAVDVDGLSQSAGAKIHMWSYVGGVNQKWKYDDFGTGYNAFKCTLGSKFISVNDNMTAETADYDTSNLKEQWKVISIGDYYVLENAYYTGKVLEVKDSSTANDATLQLADYTGADNQLFLIDGGLSNGTTEVHEISEELTLPEGSEKIAQYTLVDPYIPEAYDKPATLEDGSKRYEAEAVALTNGASLATDHSGYSGEGFVGGMWNGNATITFKINVTTAGTYGFRLGYGNGYGSGDGDKRACLFLNGTCVDGLLLPGTGSWDSWGEASFELELKAGVNTISFVNNAEEELAQGCKGDVNYDYLDMNATPNTVAAAETTYTEVNGAKHYEAEDATLDKGASLATDHTGYSGTGFVGGMYNGNATIAFNIDASETATYVVTLTYGNGFGESDGDKIAAVLLNGEFIKALPLESTGSWDAWGSVSFEVELNKGVSTLSFVNNAEKAGAKGDVNYDYIEVVKKAVEEPAEDTDETEETPSTETEEKKASGSSSSASSSTGTASTTTSSASVSAASTEATETAPAASVTAVPARRNSRSTVSINDNSTPLTESVSDENAEVTEEKEVVSEAIEDASDDEIIESESASEEISDSETALAHEVVEAKSISPLAVVAIALVIIAFAVGILYYLKVKRIK